MNGNSRRHPLGAMIAVLLAVAGCSLDYEQHYIEETMRETIPDTVFHNFTHTVVRDGRPVFRITAEKAESYGKLKQTILSGVEFQEYGTGGELITEGRADHAVFHTESEDAEFSGNLSAYSAREGGGLTGRNLTWDSETKTLSGEPDEEVNLNRDSGSSISGRGFRADFRRRTLTFERDVTGTFTTGAE
jgi:LPS export ABC transporter protein LptC